MADDTQVPWYQDPGTLIPLTLGAGAVGTLGGAYSALQQAEQNKGLYGRQINYADAMANPANVISTAQPYLNYNLSAFENYLPTLMRTQINPGLGLRGIDPASGAAQQAISAGVAPYIQQAYGNALNSAQGGMTNASNAARNATSNVPPVYGSTNGIGNALQSAMPMAMMAYMMKGGMPGRPPANDPSAGMVEGGAGGGGGWGSNYARGPLTGDPAYGPGGFSDYAPGASGSTIPGAGYLYGSGAQVGSQFGTPAMGGNWNAANLGFSQPSTFSSPYYGGVGGIPPQLNVNAVDWSTGGLLDSGLAPSLGTDFGSSLMGML